MRSFLLIAFGIATAMAVAQPYSIGTRSITFVDAVRGRDVPTQLYYPADAGGTDVPHAAGAFPVLVFGHGFVMTTAAYANVWEYFVPKGYIVALPTTEGSIAPSHATFGEDLAFVEQALQAADSDGASPFFGHVLPSSALLGHSMGGGATLLAAAGNTSIRTVVALAPAETNPSAIAAAADVLVPTMILAGANDCVTPIADHAGPIYAALTTPCRAFVSINGGGHCYFAESNFNCSFGEFTCSPSPTITRAQQHAVVEDFAGPWLDHFLKDDAQAFTDLLDSMALTTRAVCTTTCALSTGISATEEEPFSLRYDLAMQRLIVQHPYASASVQVVDVRGRVVVAPGILLPGGALDVSALPVGAYALVLRSAAAQHTRRFVVVR